MKYINTRRMVLAEHLMCEEMDLIVRTENVFFHEKDNTCQFEKWIVLSQEEFDRMALRHTMGLFQTDATIRSLLYERGHLVEDFSFIPEWIMTQVYRRMHAEIKRHGRASLVNSFEEVTLRNFFYGYRMKQYKVHH